MKDKTPYVVVALQEAARMNTLLTEMQQSMEELLLGLGGSLNMSDKMEKLATGELMIKATQQADACLCALCSSPNLPAWNRNAMVTAMLLASIVTGQLPEKGFM